MKVYEQVLEFETSGELDIVDITDEVESIVASSGIKDGICLVFVPGATGAIIVNENDYHLLEDLKRILAKLVPNTGYAHPVNARSHLRAMLLGNNQALPVKNGRLQLGTWQQIMFVELDTHARHRKVIVKVVGD